MKEYFDYDDINLIPRKCIVNSRSECDTSVKFGNYTFKLPVVPANMETVINEELSVKLADNGYFYIMHRFGTDNKKFITDMHEKGLIASISVGVNDSSYNELNELLKENIKPEYITIDIAHGHAIKMERMLKFIKDNFEDTFVIAGNVSTREGTIDLDEWGADSIKVGIGPGCFVSDAIVNTIDSKKSLKDIKIGDLVKTHKNRYKKVKQKHAFISKEPLIQINDLPPCTSDHKFYVIDNYQQKYVSLFNLNSYAKWIEAADLKKNDHLLIQYYKNNIHLINIEHKKEIFEHRELIDLTIEDDASYNIEGVIVHNSACTTYPTTGFGSRNKQASVIRSCSKITRKDIIADGGIKNPADITKSLVMGANMVMIGGMLSAFIDSPGATIEHNHILYKEFYGSASERNGKKSNRIEGKHKLLELKDMYLIDYLKYLEETLQSSISYGGGKDLSCFKDVEWF